MNIRGLIATVAALVMTGATGADAKIIASVINKTPTTVTFTGAAIALNTSGGTVVQFETAAEGPVAITFSAECTVFTGGHLEIDIVVDTKERSVTAKDNDAFCGQAGALSLNMTASRTITVNLGAGTHILVITAKMINTASSGFLDHKALVIFN